MPEGEHWSEGLTHEKLTTPEAKANLSKFETADDAHIGYLELQKTAGKPYKLPESLDKIESWPDPKDREGFRSAMAKMLGVPSSDEELNDIDFATGLPDARLVNQDLVKGFRKFVVDKAVPKTLAKDLIAFNNQFITQIMQAHEQAEQGKITKAEEYLKPLFGDTEALKKHDNRVRVLLQNHCGLSPQEYEASIEELMNAGIAKNPVLRKALFNLSKDVVPEGSTEKPGTKPAATKQRTMKDRLPRSYEYIRGKSAVS